MQLLYLLIVLTTGSPSTIKHLENSHQVIILTDNLYYEAEWSLTIAQDKAAFALQLKPELSDPQLSILGIARSDLTHSREVPIHQAMSIVELALDAMSEPLNESYGLHPSPRMILITQGSSMSSLVGDLPSHAALVTAMGQLVERELVVELDEKLQDPRVLRWRLERMKTPPSSAP